MPLTLLKMQCSINSFSIYFSFNIIIKKIKLNIILYILYFYNYKRTIDVYIFGNNY